MAINPTISSGLSNAPITGAVTGNIPLSATSIMTGTQALAQAQQTSTQNASIFTMRYSTNIPKYGFVIGLATGTPGIGGTAAQVGTLNGTITLPLPAGNTMEDRQDVAYSEYSFGALFGSVMQNNKGAINQAINSAVNSGFKNIDLSGVNLTEGPAAQQIAAAAGFGFADLVSGGLASRVIAGASGTAVNSFQTVLLQGPTYKNYTLSFNLAPQNAQESEMIRQIIVRLRKAAAPALGTLGLFWDFPEIVRCVYIPQGNDIDTYMYPFKPAVLQTVDVQYAPGGTPAFYNTTAPESVVLTLSFKELEYWIRQNYDGAVNG